MKTSEARNEPRKVYKHYHFIGIGGMGMGNLALLMLAKGYQVSGSDLKESDLTRQLSEKGARVYIGHDIRNIGSADCVVYSSAVKMDNPEMFHAHSQHIPVLRRAELLAHLVNKEVGITVAGAHGKTTTSSLASLLLIKAGLKPTTFVGGIVNQGNYNASLGMGRHIVAEVDESDGSFLYFSPHFSIITNVDAEHLDHYHTFDGVKEAYAVFAGRTVPGGVIIACGDDPNLLGIVTASGRRVVTYGFGEGHDWTAGNIQCDASGASYDCYHRGRFFSRFSLRIPGKHNVLNSLAVVALGNELKIPSGVIAEALTDFCGVQRRFQRKGEAAGVLIVDDYGHHPTEIAATLQTAKTLDRKRLLVAFQPHRYSRTKFLMQEFAASFSLADKVFLTDIYPAGEKPIEDVSAEKLFSLMKNNGVRDISYLKKEQLVDRLAAEVRPGDLVLTLGAGDITHVSDELLGRLAAESRTTALSFSAAQLGKIGVIMGGKSSEREVSLRSGAAVIKSLTEAGCRVVPMDLLTEDRQQVKEWIKREGLDVAFIALHGRFGEDGGIQSILDEMDIPYNGCGPSSSYAAFNKCVAQRLFESAGVRTPGTLILTAPDAFDYEAVEQALGEYPFVVKPACEGSSIGVSLVLGRESLVSGVRKAFEYGAEVLIQTFVRGRELTVGIIGNNPLPVVEIRSGENFYDFKAKYQSQETRYIVPAQIPEDVALKVQSEALAAYRALGCEGFGRVDVLLDSDYRGYVLEINTIPGFTASSLLPKAAMAAGMDFQKLCLTLVEMAYGKKKERSAAALR